MAIDRACCKRASRVLHQASGPCRPQQMARLPARKSKTSRRPDRRPPPPKRVARVPAQSATRDFWLPGFWPSEPGPPPEGADEHQLWVAEVGGLTFRLSAAARASRNPYLKRLSTILWLGLVVDSVTPAASEELRARIETFLEKHAPLEMRTDHTAVGAVFAFEALERLRARGHVRGLPKRLPQPPAWFPVFSKQSVALGLWKVADRALNRSLTAADHQAIREERPLSERGYDQIARVLWRYLLWCLPAPPVPLDVASVANALKSKRGSRDARGIAKTAMQAFLNLDRAADPAASSSAKMVIDNLFDEQLRRQLDRGTAEAEAEASKCVDAYRARSMACPREVISEVLGLADVLLVARATPAGIGAEFAERLAPGPAAADDHSRARLMLVRRSIARRIEDEVSRQQASTSLRVAFAVYTGLGLSPHDLLDELERIVGLQKKATP